MTHIARGPTLKATSVTGWIFKGGVYANRFILLFSQSSDHPAGMLICRKAIQGPAEKGRDFDKRTITRFGMRFEDEGEFFEEFVRPPS